MTKLRTLLQAALGIGKVARRHPAGHRDRAAVRHRLVLLDRFEVLQPTARPRALKLLLALTRSGDHNNAMMARTMKELMAKVPAGIQQAWIQGRVITNQEPAAV